MDSVNRSLGGSSKSKSSDLQRPRHNRRPRNDTPLNGKSRLSREADQSRLIPKRRAESTYDDEPGPSRYRESDVESRSGAARVDNEVYGSNPNEEYPDSIPTKFSPLPSVKTRNVPMQYHQNSRRGDYYENKETEFERPRRHATNPPLLPERTQKTYNSVVCQSDFNAAISELNNLKLQMAKLERLNSEQESRMKDSHDEVETLKKRCHQQQCRIDILQSAYDNREELFGRQEEDSFVSQQLKNLFSSIKIWCNEFPSSSSPTYDIRQIPNEQIHRVSRVIPQLSTLENCSPKRRRKFIRGWIAFSMSEIMFQSLYPHTHGAPSAMDIWVPRDCRDSLQMLETKFAKATKAIGLEAFHEWRMLTLSLLSNTFPLTLPLREWPGSTIEQLQQAVESTFLILRPLTPPGASIDGLKDRLLKEIFIPAVELSQLLRRQRACWYLQFPTPRINDKGQCLFDPEEMRDEDEYDSDEDEDQTMSCGSKLVDIFLLPSLLKEGDHNGSYYDRKLTVLKAEVSCIKE